MRPTSSCRRRSSRCARLIESSPDAIISTDRDGNVVLFNDGAETLLGYRAEEVVGRRVSLLYGGEAGANEVLREMHKRGGTVSGFESVLRAKDDSSIPVLISASVLVDEEGKGSGQSALPPTCASASGSKTPFRRRTMN